jgi:hypothetical protein
MNQVIDVAGVGSAIVFSIALGVYLEWLGLRGLMRLMPRTVRVVEIQRSAAQKLQGTKAA